MKFFDRWKKRSFEEKMDDLSQTVLTENNIKDPKQVEQYVVERLEQMIDITREIEEEKSEYRTVTSYLNDVQKLEDLPEPEKKKIADVAQNVVQLNSARNIFLNSEKKLTDAQFTQLQQEEKTMPDEWEKKYGLNPNDASDRNGKTVDEEGTPKNIVGSVIGISSLIGFIPDTFYTSLCGKWLEADPVGGYKKIFLSCILAMVIGLVCAFISDRRIVNFRAANNKEA